MDNLHDLATTVGNSAAISVLCAMAAGLAAVSLMAGVARLKRDTLPDNFPGDAEALQSKYVLAFEQLNDARKENPGGLKNIITGLRGQPAPALCLTAFDQFASAHQDDQSNSGSGSGSSGSGSSSDYGSSSAGSGSKDKPSSGGTNFGAALRPGQKATDRAGAEPAKPGNPPGKGRLKADPDANPSRLKSQPNIKGPSGDQGK